MCLNLMGDMKTNLYIIHNPTVSGSGWEVWQEGVIKGKSDILLDVFPTEKEANNYITKRWIYEN